MTRYIVSRLLSLIFVVFVVSVITFSLMHAVPGGPFDEDKQPLPPAAKANILRKYGLDQPVWLQYAKYMGNAIRLDFGIPYQQPTTTVTALIASKWPITAQVGLLTLLVAFGLGIPLGIVAAYRQNSWIDSAVTFLAMLGVTMPSFVFGTFFILLFSVRLDWLPMGGWGETGCLVGNVFCKDWIMPVFAYALGPISIIARYTRASVVDVIRSDFVRTARAKGLGEAFVMTRHVLRNALIPLVMVAGPMIPDLLTGSIFVESIFRIPGLGKYFVTSTFNRDYPMIMATVLLIATIWGLVYLLTDIIYTQVDPRIRLGAGGEQIVAEAKTGNLSVVLRPDPKSKTAVRKHRTLWQDARRRFFRNRLAVCGLCIVCFFLFCAIFANLIAPFPYDKADFRTAAKIRLLPFKNWTYPLGTDEIGRDYLSRLIYGARTSMIVGFTVQFVALFIGIPLGGLAGFLGGKVDFFISRLIDIMTAFPGLLFSILVLTLFGGGMWMVIFALSITSWIGIARLTRGQVLSLREKEYVEAARMLGVTQGNIIFRHVIPNALSPLLVAISFGIPGAIFAEAGLSFLGIGINDPIASWGKMLGVAGSYVKVSWHMALFPTLAIALSMLGFSFVGDGLRDALDPKLLE